MKSFSVEHLPVTLHQTRRGYLREYGVSLLFLVLPLLAVLLETGEFIQFISYGPAVVGVVSVALLELRIRMYKVVIEQTKIRLYKGILNREHSAASFDKITDFRVYQTIVQHLLGYGTIFVNTAAGDEYELFIEKIRNPHGVQEFLTTLEHGLRVGQHKQERVVNDGENTQK